MPCDPNGNIGCSLQGKGRPTGFQKSHWVIVEVFIIGEEVQFILVTDISCIFPKFSYFRLASYITITYGV